MNPLSTYRIAIFSTLALALALIVRQTQNTPLASDVISLTAALLPITESQAARYAIRWLKARKLNVTTQAVSTDHFNILALHPEATISDIRVILSTHLDVVPGRGRSVDVPILDGSKVRGRGAVDARGQAAALMYAMDELKDKRVGLLLVTGEETNHSGMIEAQQLGLKGVLINAEPTESKLATGQKGAAKLILRAKGKSAHSGYPELGVSATHNLITCLNEVLSKDWGEATTVNVGRIEGGGAINVVADHAEATVMFRLGTKDVDLDLQCDGVEAEILARVDPMEYVVPKGMGEVLGTVRVRYNTDAVYWKGGGVVVFGGGSIHTAHGEDEWIEVEELKNMVGHVKGIAEELLQMGE